MEIWLLGLESMRGHSISTFNLFALNWWSEKSAQSAGHLNPNSNFSLKNLSLTTISLTVIVEHKTQLYFPKFELDGNGCWAKHTENQMTSDLSITTYGLLMFRFLFCISTV